MHPNNDEYLNKRTNKVGPWKRAQLYIRKYNKQKHSSTANNVGSSNDFGVHAQFTELKQNILFGSVCALFC